LFLRKGGAPPPSAPVPSPDERSADARIKALQARIAALEADAARTGVTRRVTAPFEVVDREGKRVFFVGAENGDWKAALYNTSGAEVTRLSATGSGGYFVAKNPSGSLMTTIGAVASEANVKILEAGSILRAELGSGSDTEGQYRLVFLSKLGQPVARLGEIRSGGGSAAVAGSDGVARAGMTFGDDNRGAVYVQNAQGQAVARLTEGGTAGGLLKITSSTGEVMVDAGVNPGGFGIVRTGPGSFMMAAGIGLPGSFIMGKAK
jgi:hypothetical protein